MLQLFANLLLPSLPYKFSYAVLSVTLYHALSTKCEDDLVYKSYQTSVYCKASHPVQYPANAEELQAIISKAIASNQTVKLIGSRHSLTDVICTDGIPIDTHNINYTRLSDDHEMVTVGSGAQLIDVLDEIREHGRTLIAVPAFGGITIGGAIGTGAHGSSLLHPSTISDQVVGLTIIDGLGQIRKIENGDEDLRAFRVHLGLLGAIIDVTLKTVPLFKMTVHNYLETESILFDGKALREAQLHPWYQLWWFPSSKMVVVSKGNYTRPEEIDKIPGHAVTNMIPDLSPSEISNGRESIEKAQASKNLQAQFGLEEFTKQSLYREVVGKPPIFTEELGNGSRHFVNPATGYAYQLQANRCTNKCAWDNGDQSIYPEETAMAFELSELPKVISKIKEILDKIPAAFLMIGVFIRFSKASDGYMSIGGGRNSIHVEWVTPMRTDPYTQPKDRIGAYQAMQQALIHEFDGRPHWGKNGAYFFTQKMLQRRPAEMLRRFQQAMRKYDPNGIFMNKFGKRILFQKDELSVDPSAKRCALQDYCICSKNADCADFQTCSKFNGLYPVCREVIPDVPNPVG